MNENKNNFWTKFTSWIKSSKSDFALFAILVVLVNLVSVRAFVRIDVTRNQTYSLSSVSKRAVKTLEEPVTVKLFYTSNLPAEQSAVLQYMKDLLVEYRNNSSGKFKYEYYDMKNAANQKSANQYGVSPFTVQEASRNSISQREVYLSLVFIYKDQVERLNAITKSDGLEYSITTKINDLITRSNMFAGATDKVTLTVYKTESFAGYISGGFQQLEDAVRGAYDEINKKNPDCVEYKVVNLETEDEKRETAEKYGLGYVEGNPVIGIVLEYNGNYRLVDYGMINMFGRYQFINLEGMNDSVTDGIKGLLGYTTKVGYLSANNELSLTERNGAGEYNELLSDTYHLEELDLSKNDIPDSMQTIIINGPKTAYSDEVLYKLDQFLVKGGNLVIYADLLNEVQDNSNPYMQMYGQPQYVWEPIQTGLEKILEKNGIKLNNVVVMDSSCASNQNGPIYYAPILLDKDIDKKCVISKNIPGLFVYLSGSVDVSEAQKDEGKKVTVLVKSSENSWASSQPENYLADKSKFKPENLAVLVEGTFDSVFDSKPGADSKELSKHVSKGSRKGKIFVACTSKYTSLLYDVPLEEQNRSFARNVVDYMNGNEDLCALRTKVLDVRPLHNEKSVFAEICKLFNMFGIPLLVLAAGLIVLYARKKHRRQIRMTYDPNNARQLDNRKNRKEEKKNE